MTIEASVVDYSNLIQEAFIDPIRSVLIIDDDYPTWEEILDDASFPNDAPRSDLAAKAWLKNPGAVLDIVKNFRQKKPALIVDIYDGKHKEDLDEEKLASHLHQSDMLVLDYQLEGPAGNGKKAQRIVRELLKNDHFNCPDC